MRKWNLPQLNTKVMCAVLTAAMVMTGFTACGGMSAASAASTEASEEKDTIAPESATEQSAESSEEKVESYLGQITAIDGDVISIALAEKPEAPDGEMPIGEAPNGQSPDNNGQVPDGGASNGEAPGGNGQAPDGSKPNGQAPDGNGGAPNGEAPGGNGMAPDGQAPDGGKPNGQAPDGNSAAPNGADPNAQKPEKDMLDNMPLTLSGDTMTITVNDNTIITIDGKDATLDELQIGDTVSFFLDGEIVTSLSVGMPEPTQPMQAPEQK